MRTPFARFLDEAHLGTARQTVEILTHDAIAMEINGPLVTRFDAAKILRWFQQRNPSGRPRLVMLDVVTMHAFIIFKLLRRPECVVQCHERVLMTVVLVVLFARNDFAAGHSQIDMYLIELPLMVMLVRGIDRNVAAH